MLILFDNMLYDVSFCVALIICKMKKILQEEKK